ncbi:MAG: M20/M25/M40 family metallo-hydrolase, partial [Actinobacteria bacterium]|nr:M20/M25/M40 family metallo-hydrolase [Actinomycetota bacterium]
VQEMLDVFSFAATATDVEVETTMRKSYSGYRLRRDEEAVRLAAAALERCGHEVTYTLSGGAADANVFNDRGRRCVNLSNAMTDIHTPDERITVADLEAMVDVTVALVEEARA